MATVHKIPRLDEHRVASRPVARVADQTGDAKRVYCLLIVAVNVADGHEPGPCLVDVSPATIVSFQRLRFRKQTQRGAEIRGRCGVVHTPILACGQGRRVQVVDDGQHYRPREHQNEDNVAPLRVGGFRSSTHRFDIYSVEYRCGGVPQLGRRRLAGVPRPQQLRQTRAAFTPLRPRSNRAAWWQIQLAQFWGESKARNVSFRRRRSSYWRTEYAIVLFALSASLYASHLFGLCTCIPPPGRRLPGQIAVCQ
mmetsp:Transcript_22748/g.57069  ORF Transcript_22748/g.57069 Transcript_22748/m.57069 type:complete len:252 (+) Transcript_22748:504-1259(+)